MAIVSILINVNKNCNVKYVLCKRNLKYLNCSSLSNDVIRTASTQKVKSFEVKF